MSGSEAKGYCEPDPYPGYVHYVRYIHAYSVSGPWDWFPWFGYSISYQFEPEPHTTNFLDYKLCKVEVAKIF